MESLWGMYVFETEKVLETKSKQVILYLACSFQIGMLFSLLDFSGSRHELLYSLFFRVEGMLVPVLYLDAA